MQQKSGEPLAAVFRITVDPHKIVAQPVVFLKKGKRVASKIRTKAGKKQDRQDTPEKSESLMMAKHSPLKKKKQKKMIKSNQSKRDKDEEEKEEED